MILKKECLKSNLRSITAQLNRLFTFQSCRSPCLVCLDRQLLIISSRIPSLQDATSSQRHQDCFTGDFWQEK
jgi:hypothetical protein